LDRCDWKQINHFVVDYLRRDGLLLVGGPWPWRNPESLTVTLTWRSAARRRTVTLAWPWIIDRDLDMTLTWRSAARSTGQQERGWAHGRRAAVCSVEPSRLSVVRRRRDDDRLEGSE